MTVLINPNPGIENFLDAGIIGGEVIRPEMTNPIKRFARSKTATFLPAQIPKLNLV
jgi:hypothetical protein